MIFDDIRDIMNADTARKMSRKAEQSEDLAENEAADEPDEPSQAEPVQTEDFESKQELEAAKRQLAARQAQEGRITAVLNGFGYQGSLQDIADQLEAAQRQMQPQEVKQEREQNEARFSSIEQAHRAELTMLEDLHRIQQVNPAIKSMEELGSDFVKLRFMRDGSGELVHTAQTAYLEMQKRKTARKPDNSDKEHIITSGGGASKATLSDIPQSEVGIYKDMFPDDTPAQLKERYNRVLKRQENNYGN